jgi:hypothetical protein
MLSEMNCQVWLRKNCKGWLRKSELSGCILERAGLRKSELKAEAEEK